MTFKITKPRIPWKHKEHLATPQNVAKYEFACCADCAYRKQYAHYKNRKQRPSKVRWIVKAGEVLENE